MANKKITELTNYTTPQDIDVFALVDIANTETKKITVANLSNKMKLTSWIDLASNWDVAPTLNKNIIGGSVYNYTLNGITRYRFVPSTYAAIDDAFYENFDNSLDILSDIIVQRGY
jgi:hypothetical protein